MIGKRVEPAQTTDALQDIYDQINQTNIRFIVDKLVSFGNRNTLSTQTNATFGIGAARDWIAATMRTYAEASNGTMTIEVPSYIQQPDRIISTAANVSDITATIRGSEDPNRTYVISGHYDSRVSNVTNAVDYAPGADDE